MAFRTIDNQRQLVVRTFFFAILSNIQNVLQDVFQTMHTSVSYGEAYPPKIKAVKAFVRYGLDPCPCGQESQYWHARFEGGRRPIARRLSRKCTRWLNHLIVLC